MMVVNGSVGEPVTGYGALVSDRPKYVDPEGDPEAEHEVFQPEQVPKAVEKGWEESEAMEGQAPSG
jgi:hypothetical protein